MKTNLLRYMIPLKMAWRFCWLPVLVVWGICLSLSIAETPIVFEDVTETMGLKPHLIRWELGHAGAWGDVNGNGYPDLYIGAFADRPLYGEPDAPIPNMLFLNQTNRFILSPDEGIRLEGQRARASMALFVDLNNNERLDLLVGTHLAGGGPESQLFRNRWPAPFENVTPDWPRTLEMRNATAIDLDQDGLLDLLFFDGAYRGDEQGVMALRNMGDFRFENVTEDYGLPTRTARTLGSAIGDVNNNGRLDLFLADCNRMFISDDNGMYREYRPGFFRQPKQRLRRAWSHWPCGAVFADLTGNDLLDLVITVHGSPAKLFLYVNRGIDVDGMPIFEEATEAAGLKLDFPASDEPRVLGAHFALADLNNNGRRDILLAMIHRDAQDRVQPYVLRHTGVVDGVPRFEAPSPDGLLGYYATAPVADFDRDGRMDIFMANWFDYLDSHLFRNVTEGGNYLTVQVRGDAPDLNRMGVGATVRLYAEGKLGEAEHLLGRGDITLGHGYSCGEEALAHFGLGTHERCDVEITWQGRTVRRQAVEVNQQLLVAVGTTE